MSYYLLFSKINYSFFITFNLSHYSYVFGEFDSLVEVSCLDCYVNIHANFLPWEMSRGGRGGAGAPPELPKFLLIITVHCIEMYYLPLYTKDKKKLSYLLLHVSELNNLN